MSDVLELGVTRTCKSVSLFGAICDLLARMARFKSDSLSLGSESEEMAADRLRFD